LINTISGGEELKPEAVKIESYQVAQLVKRPLEIAEA